MDENTKELLYKQLEEMYENNLKNEPIISKQEYLELPSAEALKYIFNYRDSADFGIDEDDGSKNIYYIELPDMDLSGEDLSGQKLSEFIPATVTENGRLWPSYISFKDTNAVIDLNDIGYTRSEENDRGITDYILDFEMMDFTGCNLYGILPDEYAEYETELKNKLKSHYKTENKEGHLDERYLQRRAREHLSQEKKVIADKAYHRIMNGESLYKMRGVQSGINFADYDFSKLNQNQVKALINGIKNYNIDLNFDVLAYEDYVDDILYSLRGSDNMEKVIMKEYERGNIGFIDAHSDSIDSWIIGQIAKLEYEKGNEEFARKHWHTLSSNREKQEIAKREYEKGNTELIINNLKSLEYRTKYDIAIQASEKGDEKFLEVIWDKLEDSIKSKVIEIEYEEGNLEFVDAHIDSIKMDAIDIMKKEYAKGNFEFVGVHFDCIEDSWLAEELLDEEYKKGNMKFVNAHLDSIKGRRTASIIVGQEYKKGNMEFVNAHLPRIDSSSAGEIVEQEYEKGNKEFVNKNWEVLRYSRRMEITKQACEKGDKDFISAHWHSFNLEERSKIIEQAILSGKADVETIKAFLGDFIKYEEYTSEIVGTRRQSCSGKLLYDILDNDDVSVDVALELINAGTNVNYESYKAEKTKVNSRIGDNEFEIDGKKITYKPILMKALEIEDEDRKEKVLKALLDANVNTRATMTEITYSGAEKTQISHTAMEDDFLAKIINERNAEQLKEKREKSQNNIQEMLTKEIGLSPEEISKLEITFQDYGNSIYDCSYEKLKLQKQLLSSVNCEKEGFTKNARVLFLDPKVIYARMKFFMDNNIKINQGELHKTIALTNKKFIMTYGAQILGIDKIDDESLHYKVRRKLLDEYPMPLKKEQLIAELKSIKEKNNEKEMD